VLAELSVQLDRQVLRGQQVLLVSLARRALRDHRVLLDRLDRAAHWERQDPQEEQVHPDLQDLLGLLARAGLLEQRERQALQVQVEVLEEQEQLVPLVQLELLEPLALKETMVLADCQAQPDYREQLETQDHRVQSVLLALVEPLDYPVPLELQECRSCGCTWSYRC